MKHRFLSILSAAVIVSTMASPIFSTAADVENGTETSSVTSTTELSSEKSPTFIDVLGDRFKIGSIIYISDFSNYSDYLTDNFNIFAPTYCFTPDMLLSKNASIELGENDNPQIDLHLADSMLKYCEENEIPISPGTFVYYSQTPSWFFKENFKDNAPYVNEEIMNKRLENFIKNIFEGLKKNYPNLIIDSYEVCKEVFTNDGSFDIADAVMLSKIITSGIIPENCNPAGADLDGDGEITVFDLLTLRTILLTTNS